MPNNLLALDWGSAKTRVWTSAADTRSGSDSEIIRLEHIMPQWHEETVLAVETASQKVIAIGHEAAAMEGRVTSSVEVWRPVQRGRIYDQIAARAFLQAVWQQTMRSRMWWQPTVAVTVPAASTSLDRFVFSRVLEQAGAQEVVTVAQPLAAAIGAGVPVADATGSFIVQLGYEVIEAGVISLGTLVNHHTTWHAGKWLIERIRTTIQEQFSLLISTQTAEQLLHQVLSLDETANREMLMTGQDIVSHSPRELVISSTDLAATASDWGERVVELVQDLLAAVLPELTTDVIDKGLLLSGGLAQVHGLEQFMIQRLGTPVSTVDDPEITAIRGVATILQHIQEYQRSLAYVTTQTH